MKKLPEEERLERGVQILLTAQDKADLETMAREAGVSLAAAARPHVLHAIDRWRKTNPEQVASPADSKPRSIVVNGKVVRTARSAEIQRNFNNGGNRANGHVTNGQAINGQAINGHAANGHAANGRGENRRVAERNAASAPRRRKLMRTR